MSTGNVQTTPIKRRREWLWLLAMVGTIVWASDHDQAATPEFTDWIPSFDKVVHFSIYGLLATLALRAARGRWALWPVLVAVSLFGASDEWHQSFIPGRSSDVRDWLADTLGAALALALYTRWDWYRAALEAPLGRKARVEMATAIASISDT